MEDADEAANLTANTVERLEHAYASCLPKGNAYLPDRLKPYPPQRVNIDAFVDDLDHDTGWTGVNLDHIARTAQVLLDDYRAKFYLP